MVEHLCPWYLAYLFDNPLRRVFHQPEKMFGSYVKPGMTVMDVGCGMGFFSLGLARLVGDSGEVVSVDLQRKMLDITKKRAEKAGLGQRIAPRLARKDGLGLFDLEGRIDFVLTFWMVHEVKDIPGFLKEVKATMKQDALMVMVEPKGHVNKNEFEETVGLGAVAGLKPLTYPHFSLSRSVLFQKV